MHRYTIYDLNVQSAIAYPNHDETLPLKELADEATYDIKGYAYAGGGQRISRVEISLDDGDTWLLAHITYPEDLYRSVVATDSIYGTLDLSETDNCFAWCFWTFRCPVAKLKTSAVIMVRAMDSAMNSAFCCSSLIRALSLTMCAVQPRDMYWNATSMLNNWWFRVAILHETSDDGAIDQLRFEHPTMAGVVGGGWMARFAAEGKDVFKPVFGKAVEAKSDAKKEPAIETMKKEGVDRIITRGELAEHANEKEAWFVVNGEVGSLQDFLPPLTDIRTGVRRRSLPRASPWRRRIDHARGWRRCERRLYGDPLVRCEAAAHRLPHRHTGGSHRYSGRTDSDNGSRRT